jgi:AcrR family transcriptional regulator
MLTGMSTSGLQSETPVRRRTRRAIIDAAVHVWARDFNAPLGAVAQQAGVSRSTLHRYFSDRPALVDACLRSIPEAFGAAEPGEGVGSGAPTGSSEGPVLEELAAELQRIVQRGDWVLFLWGDPTRFAGHPVGDELFAAPAEDTLARIRRGQADGSLDPEVPASWLLDVYYSLLYCAAEQVVRGAMPAHEAGRMAVRALRSGLTPG